MNVKMHSFDHGSCAELWAPNSAVLSERAKRPGTQDRTTRRYAAYTRCTPDLDRPREPIDWVGREVIAARNDETSTIDKSANGRYHALSERALIETNYLVPALAAWR